MKTPPHTLPTEFEATFINVDKAALRTKLQSLGATLLLPETLMRRTIFDIDKHSFARVRDEGNRITMSYKHVDSLTLSGTKEICLEVDNYQHAIDFLRSCGLKIKAVQETYREEWRLGQAELDIDTWPWLPSFVEIEGPNEASVQATAGQLGYAMSDAFFGAVDQIYKVYYDVTDDDINYCPEICFTEIPAWLAQKRRQNN